MRKCTSWIWVFLAKKASIRETLNLLTNADSITIATKRKKFMGVGSNFFFGLVQHSFFLGGGGGGVQHKYKDIYIFLGSKNIFL